MDKILTRAQIPFGGLEGRMAQQKLDLIKLAAGGAAQLRARAVKVVGRDARNADLVRGRRILWRSCC
jgi:hypothetical protein